MTDVKYIFLKNLIEFVYKGEVNIFQEHLPELLRIAELLKIKGLEEIPSFNFSNDVETQETVQQRDEQISDNNVEQKVDICDDNDNSISVLADIDSCKKIDEIDSDNNNQVQQQVVKKATKTIKTSYESRQLTNDGYNMNDLNTSTFRRLRSTTAIGQDTPCSTSAIPSTTITRLNADDFQPFETNSDKNQMVINIDPHNLYNPYSIDGIQTIKNPSEDRPSLHTPQSYTQQDRTNSRTKRKMIRTNANFLRALESVRFDGIGFCKAARMHGVNNRTLWLEYQKLGYPSKKSRKMQKTEKLNKNEKLI